MTDQIRAALVEDHAMVAAGLAAALEAAGTVRVLGVATSAAEAVRIGREHGIDVLVMDYRLDTHDPVENIATVRAGLPDVPILMLSAYADERAVAAALDAGASGFLRKDQPIDDLIDAVHAVHRGELAVAPALTAAVLSRLAGRRRIGADLTTREREVLQLLAEGASTHEIAAKLFLSVNTVRNHVQRLITKLRAHSKLEAVAIGLREGLVRVPEGPR